MCNRIIVMFPTKSGLESYIIQNISFGWSSIGFVCTWSSFIQILALSHERKPLLFHDFLIWKAQLVDRRVWITKVRKPDIATVLYSITTVLCAMGYWLYCALFDMQRYRTERQKKNRMGESEPLINEASDKNGIAPCACHVCLDKTMPAVAHCPGCCFLLFCWLL